MKPHFSAEQNLYDLLSYLTCINIGHHNSDNLRCLYTSFKVEDFNCIFNLNTEYNEIHSEISEAMNFLNNKKVPFLLFHNAKFIFPKKKSSKVTDTLICMFLASSKIVNTTKYNFEFKEVNDLKLLHYWSYVTDISNDYKAGTILNFINTVFSVNKNPPIKLFVVMHNDKPIACSTLFLSNDTAGIYWVGVLPENRNKGIGLYLVNMTANFAKEMGYKSIVLQSVLEAETLYTRIGFEKKGLLKVHIYREDEN